MIQNDQKRIAHALALAAITSWFFVETAIADQKAFSQPTTPPEKALHAILQWHTQHFEDKQLHAFLTQQNGRNKAQDRLYEGKYTN
jgi:hypothetical protein